MQLAGAPTIELYLSRGCCGGDPYAQANDCLLFTLSERGCLRQANKRVLRDARSVPLLHSIRKGYFRERVYVYNGDVGRGGSLILTLKDKKFFSNSNFRIFLAGSSLDGPSDYKMKSSYFGGTVRILRQKQLVAKAKPGGWVCCGCCGPDYTISTFPGMDQAIVVLLIAIYDDYAKRRSSA